MSSLLFVSLVGHGGHCSKEARAAEIKTSDGIHRDGHDSGMSGMVRRSLSHTHTLRRTMIELHRLSVETGQIVSQMVGELLKEIVDKTGSQTFEFDLESTTRCLSGFLAEGLYDGFIVRDGNTDVGFATISQSHALYAGGALGTFQEFCVRPPFRSRGVGSRLLGCRDADYEPFTQVRPN